MYNETVYRIILQEKLPEDMGLIFNIKINGEQYNI